MHQPFYNAEISRANAGPQNPSVEASAALMDFLHDELLLAEVIKGNVTLAMVRPGLETATNIEGSDTQIAETIEDQAAGLGVMAKFAVVFDMAAINLFYKDAKENMLREKPRVNPDYASQWDEFGEVMTGGPTTVLLLHSPDGNAVETWRRQIGHWNIEKNRDPETIRGKFGINNYNNLVHGSDAPESVLREIEIIQTCLMR